MLRRILLILALVALATGCAGLKKVFGNSSKKENVEPPAELTKFEPTVSVKRLWSTDLGKGEEKLGVRQQPAVADGRVYAFDDEGRVRALDAASGKTLWRTEKEKDKDKGYELRLSGGPGVGEGLVVVGGLDGEVIALDAEGGDERWRATVSSEVISAALIAQGVAVVRVNDGRVYGFDAADGRRRWVFDRGLPNLTVRGNAAPVLGPGLAYLGYDDGTVVALRLEDGLQVWEQVVAQPEGRTELERMADVDGTLQAGASEVYAISYKGQTVAISAPDGRPLWNRELGSYAGLGLTGDRLVAADSAGTVWALDRNSGSALWKQDALAHRWLSTPVVQGNYAVVGDFDGYLHWLDLESGELAARTRLSRDPVRGAPAVSSEGVLYVMSTDGDLAAYRLGE